MRKILFVCLALRNGGAERVVSILSQTLNEKNYDVFVLPLLDNEPIYNVGNAEVIVPKRNTHKRINRILEIRRCIRDYRIDTIIAFAHYNAMYSVIAAFGKNMKVIGSERNDPAQEQSRWLLNSARRLLYKGLDCLVCQTNEAKAYFPEDIQKKTVVIMNPIKKELPEPYTGEREKRIVSFSRLEPQKNIPMLIDAFRMLQREHRDYILEIYGDGKEKDILKKRIEDVGLKNKVFLYPFAKDIHERVLKASAFALASNYEGLSNAMLESMAIGLPTIVTDCPCGGARMVIKDGENGVLVPVGNTEAMYRAMKRVIEDQKFAKIISQNSVGIRNILDADKIADQWISVIEHV